VIERTQATSKNTIINPHSFYGFKQILITFQNDNTCSWQSLCKLNGVSSKLHISACVEYSRCTRYISTVCTAAGNPVSDAVGCIDTTSVGNAMSPDAGSYGSRPWMPTSDSEQARVLTYLLSMKFTMRCDCASHIACALLCAYSSRLASFHQPGADAGSGSGR
jgi:hypothetical protein